MANEAVEVEGPHATVQWTVNSASAIEQYTLMEVETSSTTRLAMASQADSPAPPFAGIAMTEKESTSSSTSLGLTKEGVFELVAKTVDITEGAAVVISGLNTIRAAVAAELLTGAVVGHALVKITGDAAGEVQLIGNS